MLDIVKTMAKAQCLPESFVAYSALAHGAAAIGNSVEVRCYADGGAEPPNVWMGSIADSGVGKSEVAKKLGKPFEVIDRGYIAAFKEESAQHQRDMAQYQREVKAGKEGDVPTAPIEKHLVIGDATMESIFSMCSNNPHGLLLSQPEGRLFFSMDSYRTARTDEPNYCKLYDRTYFKVCRKGGQTISGIGMISVAMMIQPGNFRNAIKENPGMKTSGLLARMNLHYPVIGEFHITEQIDPTAYQNWDKAISGIIDRRTADGTPTPVYLDDTAQATWNRYMADCRNLARRTEGWLGGYYDRLHVTAIRLALQFHYFECGGTVMKSSFVERGIEIAEYMKAQNEQFAEMFAGEVVGGVPTAEQQDVLKVLRNWQPSTEAELRDHSRILERMENLHEVLQQLVKSGIIRAKYREGNGVEGRCITEYSIITAPAPPENPGDFQGSGYTHTDNASENEVSTPNTVDDFGEHQHQEPAQDSGLQQQETHMVADQEMTAPASPNDEVSCSASYLPTKGTPPDVEVTVVKVQCENCRYRNEGLEAGLCRVGKVQQNRPDCPGFRATESAIDQAARHLEFAIIIRETLNRESGKNVVNFETDILPYFDGDRVPASSFLRKFGFEVKEIDGEQRIVETRTI